MSRLKMTATEGMILTNGEVYGRVVYLGSGDNPDNWWEITEAEYESITENTEISDDSATAADYQAALREMGVKV